MNAPRDANVPNASNASSASSVSNASSASTALRESSARDEILRAVQSALPPAVAAPAPRDQVAPSAARGSLASSQPTPLDAFESAATAAGATIITAARSELPRLLAGTAGDASTVLSTLAELPSTASLGDDPHSLATLELYVTESSLGVAENGAVWIAPCDEMHRAALFLAQRVAIVIDESRIVEDLHEAYARLDLRAQSFGVFVAGPSKTADIEQALVIGAHGPKELTLIVVRAR